VKKGSEFALEEKRKGCYLGKVLEKESIRRKKREEKKGRSF